MTRPIHDAARARAVLVASQALRRGDVREVSVLLMSMSGRAIRGDEE